MMSYIDVSKNTIYNFIKICIHWDLQNALFYDNFGWRDYRKEKLTNIETVNKKQVYCVFEK